MDMKPQYWSGTVPRPIGLIVRQKDPNNLEMPFDQLGDSITPTELPRPHTLLARARGANQCVQPDSYNPNFGSYVIDHPLPIEVFVAAP
jgi:hypothetical protein